MSLILLSPPPSFLPMYPTSSFPTPKHSDLPSPSPQHSGGLTLTIDLVVFYFMQKPAGLPNAPWALRFVSESRK